MLVYYKLMKYYGYGKYENVLLKEGFIKVI